jgi:transcriptional regulator with XRE-family HTH domain
MNKTFQNRLEELLADKNLKTRDLVIMSDLSKQAIYDILRGRVVHYNKKFIEGLYSQTGVSLDWLLLGKGAMYSQYAQTESSHSLAEGGEPYLAATKGQKETGKQKNEQVEHLQNLLEEKDKRIKDLQGQVEFLKNLLNK